MNQKHLNSNTYSVNEKAGGNTMWTYKKMMLLLTIAFLSIACLFGTWGSAQAASNSSVIRTGTYDGRWHNQAVKFSIRETQNNGTFRGIAVFTTAPHKGTRFEFWGEVNRNGSLKITRYVRGGTQVALTGSPRIRNNQYVWTGTTTGTGIGGSLSFVLAIPTQLKTGTYNGRWHDQAVKFSIREIQGNGTFRGIAVFTTAPHKDTRFEFWGEVNGNGSLKITRYVRGGTQVALTGSPRISNNHYVWTGSTRGVGIGGSLSFVLAIPR